jgi:membrane-bound lytic murein transglycosylase D
VRYDIVKIAAVVLLVLLAGSCAQAPSKTRLMSPGSGKKAPVDEAAVNAIYGDIARATASADDALKRWSAGDAAGATQAMTAARELLTAAAGRCAQTAGCEIERVLAAQDAVIERQARELIGSLGDEQAPTEEAGEAGVEQSPVVRAMPEAARSVALLKGKDLRTIITMNEPVKAALEEWLTWLRPNLLEAHENYQYMRHRMWPVYEQAGLPEALLFGILAKESGGKVHAVSRAGASGPLQFMPHTGRRYGLGTVGGFDQRFDPTAATRANAAYLNDQFRLLNDDLALALGAYNGGEGRMMRLSQGGRNGFWGAAMQSRLPPETRDYVPMVLAAAWLFLHPEEHNLVFPRVDATPSALMLESPISLSELSVCMGQDGNGRGWFRTLRNLNPRYDANVPIPAGTRLEMPKAAVAAYERHCKSGPLLALSRDLHEARGPSPAPMLRVASTQTHVVRRGETLSSIARKFGCKSLSPIATANRLKAPRYPIRAGQRLVVPACRAS